MICDGPSATAGIDDDKTFYLSDESLQQHLETSRLSPFEEKALKSYLDSPFSFDRKKNSYAICYITTIDNWDPEKKYQSRGFETHKSKVTPNLSNFIHPIIRISVKDKAMTTAVQSIGTLKLPLTRMEKPSFAVIMRTRLHS